LLLLLTLLEMDDANGAFHPLPCWNTLLNSGSTFVTSSLAKFQKKMPFKLLNAALLLLLLPQACAFVGIQKLAPRQKRHRPPSFFAGADGVDKDGGAPVALPPASSSPALTATTAEDGVDKDGGAQVALPPVRDTIDEDASSSPSSTATTAFMMNQSSRRILIEELGYRRQDVDCMRVEIAGSIIEKRLKCPPEGMPASWKIEKTNGMMERLENESKYPLKVPLLGVSLVLAGKGLSDAIVTAIKVNMAFNGASLTEEFMGVPVLLIDFVCVILGIALGTWTWKNMGDD
jgi:hypothetical protein